MDCSISTYDEKTGSGLVRHLYIRKAVVTGEIMVCLVINGKTVPKLDLFIEELKKKLGNTLASVILNINTENTNVILGEKCVTVYGKDFITDVLSGVKVKISPKSFYQVNHSVAEMLYKKAAEYAEADGADIIDLYCGAGTIGLSMASKAHSVTGVEIIPEAVEDAKYNAELNEFKNCRFFCGDAAEAAKVLLKEGLKPDVVILDPPRKGCSAELIETVSVGFAPDRVVYVSCDSATLARDCRIFKEYGYNTLKAAPFDMFPRTGHVETVCLLSRRDK
jgi:23S rRNA (uracil1939-C5)-methyltransferase